MPRGGPSQAPQVPGQARRPEKRQRFHLGPRPKTPRPTNSRHSSAPRRRHFVASSKRDSKPASGEDPQGPANPAGVKELKLPQPPEAPPEARRNVGTPKSANFLRPCRPIRTQRPGSDGAEIQ